MDNRSYTYNRVVSTISAFQTGTTLNNYNDSVNWQNYQNNFQSTNNNYSNNNDNNDQIDYVTNNLISDDVANNLNDEYEETFAYYDENFNDTNRTIDEEVVVESSEDAVLESSSSNKSESDSSLQTIIIILSLVILGLFSLSLIRLKNRRNDKDPVNEKGIYDKNKPLPVITPDIMNKSNQGQIKIQTATNDNINTNYNNDYGQPNVIEYDLQQQDQQYNYDDDRISYLALGDSAIEPRQATLNLKENVIKKSKDNLPIPLVHIKNSTLNANNENINNEDDDDNINLKSVEPLPGTDIPSKKTSLTNHNFIQDSHDLFKKVSRGVKNVGNKLNPNSIISTISSSSKSSSDQNTNNQYSILPSPKV